MVVHSIHPKQLDHFRDRFTAAGAKDDRRDAHVLADSAFLLSRTASRPSDRHRASRVIAHRGRHPRRASASREPSSSAAVAVLPTDPRPRWTLGSRAVADGTCPRPRKDGREASHRGAHPTLRRRARADDPSPETAYGRSGNDRSYEGSHREAGRAATHQSSVETLIANSTP
jgi:hypothetical protein